MERRRSIPNTLAAALTLGACITPLALESTDRPSAPAVEVVACNPEQGQALPPADVPGELSNFSQVKNGVDQTTFFATHEQVITGIYGKTTSAYYATEAKLNKTRNKKTGALPKAEDPLFGLAWNQYQDGLETDAKSFLAERGISVEVQKRSSSLTYDEENVGLEGINGLTLSQLQGLPEGIIKASGLKKIVYIKDYENNNDLAWTMPRVEGDTMYIPDDHEITNGLAEMVLEHSPVREAVMECFIKLSESKEDHYYKDYDYSKTDNANGEAWSAKYGKVFFEPDDIVSPKVEFVDLFSQALDGDNWYSNTDLKTPLGRKMQLVQAVFDNAVHRGESFEELYDEGGAYGSFGLYPTTLAARFNTLIEDLKSAPSQYAIDVVLKNYYEEVGYNYPIPKSTSRTDFIFTPGSKPNYYGN
jgi:hypothetical protein